MQDADQRPSHERYLCERAGSDASAIRDADASVGDSGILLVEVLRRVVATSGCGALHEAAGSACIGPSFDVFGTFLPAWMLCALIGIAGAIVAFKLVSALDVRLIAGANWNELMSGTNAIWTALSVGGPVCVHGGEHFCAGIKPWTCSATAVRDPANGELLGVLDVSGLRDSFNRHLLELAVSSATRIQDRLWAHELELQQGLLEWGLGHLSRTPDGGLLFYDHEGRLAAKPMRAPALRLPQWG